MYAKRLKTEYLFNPVGIDAQNPLLMWNCEDGKKQTAYRIVTENWDSGKVKSSSMRCTYPLAVEDRERVNWKICLWDENNEQGEWSEAFFEKGITEWKAKWITGNYKVNKKQHILILKHLIYLAHK